MRCLEDGKCLLHIAQLHLSDLLRQSLINDELEEEVVEVSLDVDARPLLQLFGMH